MRWAILFFLFGIVIFFLTNHAELEVIILIPCILVFMGKLLCYAHALVEKLRYHQRSRQGE